MRKSTAIGAGFVVVTLAAVGVLLLGDNAKEAKETMSDQTKTESVQADMPAAPASAKGVYTSYSEELFVSAEGVRLLFFYAPWCPQCRALDADIASKDVPANTTIFKLDYDSNQALRKKYGVTIQTTIVRVDAEGNLVKKYVAYDDPTLAAVVKGVL